MDSRINKYFFNIFFLVLVFFSVKLINSNAYCIDCLYEKNYTSHQINSNIIIDISKINYSDDLEVDTTFELQKRKTVDIDAINSISISKIIISLPKDEIKMDSQNHFF